MLVFVDFMTKVPDGFLKKAESQILLLGAACLMLITTAYPVTLNQKSLMVFLWELFFDKTPLDNQVLGW